MRAHNVIKFEKTFRKLRCLMLRETPLNSDEDAPHARHVIPALALPPPHMSNHLFSHVICVVLNVTSSLHVRPRIGWVQTPDAAFKTPCHRKYCRIN